MNILNDIYISEKLSFKRSIPKLKSQKNTVKHKFWILAWYGPSFYKKSQNRIYKKVYLINSSDTTYNLECWKGQKSFESEIPEEKSFLFPPGSIFNENGLLIQTPIIQAGNELTSLRNIIINPISHHFSKGLYNILQKTNFPVFKSLDLLVYNGASYYKVRSSNDSYDIIIPIHVINAYFYYLSTTCIYHLIYNIVEKSVYPSKKINTTPIVYYHGNQIRYQEAKTLAKYFFIGDNSTHPFIETSKSFFLNTINESKNKRPYYGYFNSKIPFKKPTNLDVIGQFIKMNNETIFMVYKITRANPIHPNKIFRNSQFIMINIEDKRSIPVETPKEIVKFTRIKDYINNIKFQDGLSSNHTMDIQDGKINDMVDIFSEEPKSTLLDKKVQERIFQSDNEISREIKGLSHNHRNHDSNSLSSRSNFSYNSLNHYFLILKNALDFLTVNDSFFVNILLINSNDGLYSTIPGQQYSNILIYSILYKENYYCIVDTGFSRIGIFKRFNSRISFQRENDSYVKKVIHTMAYKHQFNWSGIKQKKMLFQLQTQVLAALNHNNVDNNINDSIEKLSFKIKKHILTDQGS